MKKYRYGISLVWMFVWMVLLSARVQAAEKDFIRLDEKGTVTLVSAQMAEDGVSTLTFSISVDTAGADNVEFLFEECNAKLLEYRYDQKEKKMNIYIAGTKELFPDGTNSLTVGRIVIRDGNGAAASAKAGVVAGSLQYVNGSELRNVEEMEDFGMVQISGTDAPPPQITPPPAASSPPRPEEEDRDEEDSPTENNPQGTGGNTSGTGNNGQGTGGRPQGTGNQGGTVVVRVPQSTDKPSEPSASPATPTPELQEDASDANVSDFLQQPSDPSADSEAREEEDGTEGQIDWIFVLAVAAIVVFAGVAVMAFVTLNRKPEK